ncbi:MAG TPA: DUF3616 domain-containing protein [Lamprocystis sp. (in: g-proteobacteria)]|nr:DUF3616 domain-containing protein [Lamprocystis sp. (in: g-proteobacteria)]
MKGIGYTRILLRFDREARDPERLRGHLSACARDGDGHLWLGTDELTVLSRLKQKVPGVFAKHDDTDLSKKLQLVEGDQEVDVEGLDIDEDRLWIVGSHTSTRKGVKQGKDLDENLQRLTQVEARPNRCLIACATITGGRLKTDAIAQLPISPEGNALTLALRADAHLGPFLLRTLEGPAGGSLLGSKENGFDIEGVAARGERLFVGLRGPVLRGWATLLELRAERTAADTLALGPIGADGRPYRKHFLQLAGMGIRDLCWQEEDLLILAGPTMDIAGPQAVYRLRSPEDLPDDSITEIDGSRLQRLFHLPLVSEGDKAEGLCRCDAPTGPGLLVVYDAPRSERLIGDDAVLADVFSLLAS